MLIMLCIPWDSPVTIVEGDRGDMELPGDAGWPPIAPEGGARPAAPDGIASVTVHTNVYVHWDIKFRKNDSRQFMHSAGSSPVCGSKEGGGSQTAMLTSTQSHSFVKCRTADWQGYNQTRMRVDSGKWKVEVRCLSCVRRRGRCDRMFVNISTLAIVHTSFSPPDHNFFLAPTSSRPLLPPQLLGKQRRPTARGTTVLNKKTTKMAQQWMRGSAFC